MLPGFNGHLVSEYFLESLLAAGGDAWGFGGAERAQPSFAEWRRRSAFLGPASTVRTMLETAGGPLFEALGFDGPDHCDYADSPIASAVLRIEGHPLGLIVAPWAGPLDPLWRPAVTHAVGQSAAWCVLFNGTHVRLVDARRLYARRFVEFDLDLAMDDPRTFAAFLGLMRAERFGNERAAIVTLRALVDLSERHASGVCASLRDGVLGASARVLSALVEHQARASIDESFEQALTIVYRLLFLLFAEARGLLPLWHRTYRDSYSVESLRASAENARRSTGLWDAMRAIARLAHAGCRAGDLNVTPFNGRLFAPSRTPLADRRDLDDAAARDAILELSTRPAPDRGGRERIAYRDLGVEQLGGVYETLLDYEPRVERHRPSRRGGPQATVTLVSGSGVRKATGTFYTPQAIAEYLIRRTLGPLVHEASPDRILSLRIVDPAMGSGAFLVAACRYLATAYESALIRAGGCHASDFAERERAAIRRTIAERCLYGVDLNPMAVQLARLSMWLATLAADRPLTFLDHRLLAGDSLVGAPVHALGRAPAAGARRRAGDPGAPRLFDDEDMRRAVRDALPVRFTLESAPGDTVQDVRAKERALAALNGPGTGTSNWKRIADLWCASWLAADRIPPSAFAALSDVILTGSGPLAKRAADAYLGAADEVARSRRFFHWELEFPEVFFAADGARQPDAGFDAIIGNPPWDMLRADAGSAAARSESRTDLSRLLRFTRDSGVYAAQSDGHVNRYQLFLERAMSLARPGGRIGLIVPSGLATDHGSARLRAHLLDRCNVDAIVGFDNTRAVFPIHRSVRFLLITATPGHATTSVACRLGERDPAALEAIGDEPASTSHAFPVRVTPALLRRISGRDLVIPDLRSRVDVAIVERAATLFPPLGDADGWGAHFSRELNASDNRGDFGPPGAGLPIVEGKQIEPFRVDLSASRLAITEETARRLLRAARYQQPRLAYRDVAGATNRLTLIAALLPAGCVSTHTVFCLRTPLPPVAQHFLCGVFNSFVANYLVRLRVTTHVTTAVMKMLPIPRRADGPQAFRRIAALARSLAKRPDVEAAARLHALVATMYQLSADEFAHILDSFPLIPRAERDRALRLLISGGESLYRIRPGSEDRGR